MLNLEFCKECLQKYPAPGDPAPGDAPHDDDGALCATTTWTNQRERDQEKEKER